MGKKHHAECWENTKINTKTSAFTELTMSWETDRKPEASKGKLGTEFLMRSSGNGRAHFQLNEEDAGKALWIRSES